LLQYLNDSNPVIRKLVATYYIHNKTEDKAIQDDMIRIFQSNDPVLFASAISYYKVTKMEIPKDQIIRIVQNNDKLAVLSAILDYADKMAVYDQTLIDAIIEKRDASKDPKTKDEIEIYLKAFQKGIQNPK